jgi:restriction endonuclease S subunit
MPSFNNAASRLKIKLKDILVEEDIKTTSNNQHSILSSTVKGVYLQSNFFKKQIASEENIGYKILNPNRLVMSPQNAWMGNINFYDGLIIGIVSPSYKIYQVDEKYHRIIKTIVKTKRFQEQIRRISEQGASVVRRNLDLNKFLNLQIQIPTENLETYGNFLSAIDQLIEKQKEKVARIKSLKKGYLQKMFPADGKDKPEIRFKGFSGGWQEIKLGTIAKITIGEFVIQTKQNPNFTYPVFNGGSSYTGFYDKYNNEGNKIVISARGANAGYVNFVSTRYWAGNSCYSVGITSQSHDTHFVFHYVKYNQGNFKEFKQAANIPSVSKNDVENFVIKSTLIHEQHKIGSFLSAIDRLIEKEEAAIERSESLKKGYLKKIFAD